MIIMPFSFITKGISHYKPTTEDVAPIPNHAEIDIPVQTESPIPEQTDPLKHAGFRF
jgi:hypothetical protein